MVDARDLLVVELGGRCRAISRFPFQHYMAVSAMLVQSVDARLAVRRGETRPGYCVRRLCL